MSVKKVLDKAIKAIDAFEFGNGDQLRRNKQALESIRKLASIKGKLASIMR